MEGCKYRIPEEEILARLSLNGEDCSRDKIGTNGNSRSGNFSVMMKLDQDNPQLIPFCGKRITMYLTQITKLCNQCIGKHTKNFFPSDVKAPWADCFKNVIDLNAEKIGKRKP